MAENFSSQFFSHHLALRKENVTYVPGLDKQTLTRISVTRKRTAAWRYVDFVDYQHSVFGASKWAFKITVKKIYLQLRIHNLDYDFNKFKGIDNYKHVEFQMQIEIWKIFPV